MSSRVVRVLVGVGSALALVGLTGAIVFQLQPWRSCPDDTSPAACPMLPADFTAFLVFALLLVIGALALFAAAATRLTSRSAQ